VKGSEQQTKKATDDMAITSAFLLASQSALKPLLRPSAHREVGRFIGRIESDVEAKKFLTWAARVVRAHRRDARGGRPKIAARIVRSAPEGLFRRPERAYRPRYIFTQ